ncbi:hypothetical protein KJ611_03085 [Patescibacteria group bacterium]|nr:hypothetical protein [Patescibacteria group bacterium]MBU1705684.1 hypothetical protein [Patescibacteria group bacterium]
MRSFKYSVLAVAILVMVSLSAKAEFVLDADFVNRSSHYVLVVVGAGSNYGRVMLVESEPGMFEIKQKKIPKQDTKMIKRELVKIRQEGNTAVYYLGHDLELRLKPATSVSMAGQICQVVEFESASYKAASSAKIKCMVMGFGGGGWMSDHQFMKKEFGFAGPVLINPNANLMLLTFASLGT